MHVYSLFDSKIYQTFQKYSSVPNRRVGQNKRAEGIFLKINKRSGQISVHMQENKHAGGFFSQKQ